MADRKDVVQGTLDLLVLRIIATQPMHGWGVIQRLRYLTDDIFQLTTGSLFPALRRLEENGWASGYWDLSENNRKARYYAITKAGQKQGRVRSSTGSPSPLPSRRSWREHETRVVSPAGNAAASRPGRGGTVPRAGRTARRRAGASDAGTSREEKKTGGR
jgi:transcriptional regulator